MEVINSRMDGLQAAILSVKLPYIKEWSEKRRNCAKKYNELFFDYDKVKTPKTNINVKHVFHLYVIRVDNRDELKKYLNDNGISVGIHYPCPLPFIDAYKHLNCKKHNFPISYNYKDQILSLPIYPELDNKSIEFIVSKIQSFYKYI